MTQLTLDEYATARNSDPVTSHIAAKMNPAGRETDRDLVLRLLRDHGPMTDFELAALVNRQPTSLGCRRKQLCDLGLVEYAGYTRPTTTGASARVWQAL